MADCLVPTQLSEYSYCGACERVIPAEIADPPPSLSVFEGLARAYDRRTGTWPLCPHCVSGVEAVLAGLDRLAPVRTAYDEQRDHRPTACGRCGVRIDADATLLDVWGHGGYESWYTGLCGDCAEVVREPIASVPAEQPPGGEDVYWPPALTVPDEQVVTAAECEPAALRATFRGLTEGDTVRLSAHERGDSYSGRGQYLDLTARVTAQEESPAPVDGPRVVVDPVKVHHEYAAARTDLYHSDPAPGTGPYGLDLGTDLDWNALPPTLDPGDVPVVRTDGAPLAVTVLDPVSAPDDTRGRPVRPVPRRVEDRRQYLNPGSAAGPTGNTCSSGPYDHP